MGQGKHAGEDTEALLARADVAWQKNGFANTDLLFDVRKEQLDKVCLEIYPRYSRGLPEIYPRYTRGAAGQGLPPEDRAGPAGCELYAASYKPARHKLQATIYTLQVASYKLQAASYKLQAAGSQL